MKAEIQHLNGSVKKALSLIKEWRKLDPQVCTVKDALDKHRILSILGCVCTKYT